MIKSFVLTLIFSILAIDNSSADSLYQCFNNVDSSYNGSTTRRDQGFIRCLNTYPMHNPEYNCINYADRFYSLRYKKHFANLCVKQTSEFRSCFRTATYMPTYPLRTTSAMSCLKKFLPTMSKAECYSIAHEFHNISRNIKATCAREFPDNPEQAQQREQARQSEQSQEVEVIKY